MLVTVEIAEVWGRIGRPAPLPLADGLMAATALVNDWTFATRNTKGVERTGVRLVNPFEPS
jgi:predicted nucleic acid-binding protein